MDDDLADVLDDAVLGTCHPRLTLSGTQLTWAVPDVAPGATTTRCLPRTGARRQRRRDRPQRRRAGRVSAAAASAPAPPPSSPASWSLAKTSDRPDGAVVEPGDEITYTLVATNTSAAVVAGAQARDDLSAVLDDATLDFSSSQLSRAGDTLTWAIPTLAPGGNASVSYTVRVRDDARGATLTNSVVPVGSGGACTACTTTQYTAAWRLAKSSNPANGTVVAPGDTIDYTLAVTNDGPVALNGAAVTDDISGLSAQPASAHCRPGSPAPATPSPGRCRRSHPGDTATVTYRATVSAGCPRRDAGQHRLPGNRRRRVHQLHHHPDHAAVEPRRRPAPRATAQPSCPATCSATSSPSPTTARRSCTAPSSPTTSPTCSTTPRSAPCRPGRASAARPLTWQVPDVAPGATVTLPYAATVKAGAVGVDPAQHRCAGFGRRRLRRLQHHRPHRGLDAGEDQRPARRRRPRARRRDHVHADRDQHLQRCGQRCAGARQPGSGGRRRHA